MMNKLPKEYSEVITVIEGMGTITLSDLKSKLRAFYKRKFKDLNTNEIALFANGKFKGLCKNCGKQGHKAADCRSKNNTAGANKETKAPKPQNPFLMYSELLNGSRSKQDPSSNYSKENRAAPLAQAGVGHT